VITDTVYNVLLLVGNQFAVVFNCTHICLHNTQMPTGHLCWRGGAPDSDHRYYCQIVCATCAASTVRMRFQHFLGVSGWNYVEYALAH
jgi:hypothetical protein